MGRLRAVKPKAATPTKPKILIFGKPGVGKTWVSLDFPAAYYIDTEGGANQKQYTDKLEKSGGVYMGPEHGSMDFSTILDEVKLLATEKHQYKTLVVDSASKIFNAEIAAEAEKLDKAKEKNEFGRDKKPAVNYMRRLINWMSRLDMNVILVAHQKAEWGLDSKGNRTEIGSTFDCWDKLEYELDLCLNIVPGGKNSPVARVRKSRLEGFPNTESFPWSYEEFAQRYGKEIIEKQGEALVLASKEALAELAALLSRWKAPDGQEEKWLRAAKVEEYSEMSADQVAKLIEYINKQIKGE
jgi:hypothetical protein